MFISSTFADLRETREKVTWAVMKTRHIPVGMETFPATDDRGWKVIHQAIDQSDYYVLILGLTYGSTDPSTGLSYTEMEYDYAVSKGIPVMAFVLNRTAMVHADHVERDPDKLKKLNAFRDRVEGGHHREIWHTADDLVSKVTTALTRHIQEDEDDGRARPGWYRGDNLVGDPRVAEGMARLSAENADLRKQLSHKRELPTFQLRFDVRRYDGPSGTLFADRVVFRVQEPDKPTKARSMAQQAAAASTHEDAMQAYARASIACAQLRELKMEENYHVKVDFCIENDSDVTAERVYLQIGIAGDAEFLDIVDPSADSDVRFQRTTNGLLVCRMEIDSDVGPGIEQPVPAVWVKGTPDETGQITFAVTYRIGSSIGQGAQGAFNVVSRVTEIAVLDHNGGLICKEGWGGVWS
ncbi:MAG: DUF4062 domain-containing protein [Hyphomicrobium sp.]